MGATAHAIGAAIWESFAYDEEGNLLTPNFYDYHVPHAIDMPPLKTGAIESPSPSRRSARRAWARAAEAESTASAPLSRTRFAWPAAVVTDSHNPYHRVWEMLRDPAAHGTKVEVTSK